ncbi:MAG TPA: hypothetical protein VMV19_18745 [Xanthobacteraceae bacterium]|nr:hypothetical protein [Xanthobacteraceae bacterium]
MRGIILFRTLMGGQTTTTKKPDGTVIKTRKWQLAPEDVLAIGGVLVALLVVAGMILGKLPLNTYTYGLAGFSVVGAGISKIVKARKGVHGRK